MNGPKVWRKNTIQMIASVLKRNTLFFNKEVVAWRTPLGDCVTSSSLVGI